MPYEYTTSIRARLHTLKQTGTVRDYNTSFNQLIQQLPNVSFEEASIDYLQGLREEVQNLVQTQYGLKTLRDLQLATLRLDPNQHLEESKPKQSENTAYALKDNKK